MEQLEHLYSGDVWYANLGVIFLGLTTLALLYWYGTLGFDIFEKLGVDDNKSWRLPFVGDVLDIFKLSLDEDKRSITMYPQRMFGMILGRLIFLNVFDVDFLKAVTIKEFPSFMNRRSVTDYEGEFLNSQIFSTRDDHWKNVRSLLTPTFTSGKLKAMYPVIGNCADKLIKHVNTAAGEPIVIKDHASGYTMDVIASTAFGLDTDVQSTKDHPFVQHAGTFFGIPRKKTWLSQMRQGFALIMLLVFPPWISKVMRVVFGISFFFDQESVDYFGNIVDQIMEERGSSSEERNDFVGMCIDKVVDLKDVDPKDIRTTPGGIKWTEKGLTRCEVLANAAIFFSAGYETTATAIQFLFFCLTVHPDIQEQLYDKIKDMPDEGFTYEELQKFDYLEWCINETMRMFPPVLRFDRQAKKDVVVNGIPIPEGMVVSFTPAAIHYNPEYWPDPNTFNPFRFSPEHRTETQQYAFVPFGSGGRSCIATRLAMLEIKVATCKVLKHFRLENTADTPGLADLKLKKMTPFLTTASPLSLKAVPR